MVTVRYWAAARAAAGRDEETLPACDLGELLTRIAERHDISRVLSVCSLLVDGAPVHREDTGRGLASGAVVDVLPPFAGG
ncbi:MAG TPA: MoaD/ThiS family protein [Mycobacteriales bacterium]|nr:MoaD/ThiS family protein [Mycobacteriales bacterium]